MDKKRNELSELIQGIDYTVDSLGRFIFTREYHLKRGYCCENGCLNCPYPIKFPTEKTSTQ
jgi:hypothetical protein